MNTPPVTAREIADLLAWRRSITATPPSLRDPDQIAAYQTAKRVLLSRIDDHPPENDDD